jgi:hypothetical protein
MFTDACFAPTGNTRPQYTAAGIARRNLWWYQSCMSHGCDGGCTANPFGACEQGWPSYMIDHSAVMNRVRGVRPGLVAPLPWAG